MSSPGAWRTLRDAGFAFAFVQAAIGPRPNEAFQRNWSMAKACGFPRGAYQFVSPTTDGASLAKVLLDTLGDDRGELPVTLDLEKPPSCEDDCCGQSCTDWTVRTAAWVDAVEKRGAKAMLYVVEPFFARCLCASPRWKDRKLWLAAWPRFDFPPKPRLGEFGAWDFYQYEGNVVRYGGVIDLDLFGGTRSDFEAWRSRP